MIPLPDTVFPHVTAGSRGARLQWISPSVQYWFSHMVVWLSLSTRPEAPLLSGDPGLGGRVCPGLRRREIGHSRRPNSPQLSGYPGLVGWERPETFGSPMDGCAFLDHGQAVGAMSRETGSGRRPEAAAFDPGQHCNKPLLTGSHTLNLDPHQITFEIHLLLINMLN